MIQYCTCVVLKLMQWMLKVLLTICGSFPPSKVGLGHGQFMKNFLPENNLSATPFNLQPPDNWLKIYCTCMSNNCKCLKTGFACIHASV